MNGEVRAARSTVESDDPSRHQAQQFVGKSWGRERTESHSELYRRDVRLEVWRVSISMQRLQRIVNR